MADDQNKVDIDFGKLRDAEKSFDDIKNNVNGIQSDVKEVNKGLEKFNSLTDQLNNALQATVKTVKDINTDYLKYYELKKKVTDATNLSISNENKIAELQRSTNIESQKAIDIIKIGLDARRDLGEELTKSEAAQEALNKTNRN